VNDLSVIETGWPKLKMAWRTTKAWTREALEHADAPVLATMTVADAHN
jgi:hypothetical protein